MEVRDEARRAGRRRQRQRHGRASVECLRQRLLVDGVGGSEPHVLVGEAHVVAHLQQDDAGDGVELAREARLILEALHLAHRYRDRHVDLAGLDGGDARRGVLDDLEGDAIASWAFGPQ